MRRILMTMAILLAMSACGNEAPEPSAGQANIEGPRLYVLDGGVLQSDPTRYRLSMEEVQESALSVAAYLIVHPDGVLLWDAGAVADTERISPDAGPEQRVVRYDGSERFVTLALPLAEQLRAAGYEPSDVTHLGLSHYHWDHTANANMFADALWLVTPAERERMFAEDPPGGTRGATYSQLADSPTVSIETDEYDVFGDGTVVMKQTPGHTEGHLVLYVALERTGGVVLSGDLYHYPEERSLNRLPTFDVSEAQTAASRSELEKFLEQTGAELWIQHDLVHHRTRRLAPEYYD